MFPHTYAHTINIYIYKIPLSKTSIVGLVAVIMTATIKSIKMFHVLLRQMACCRTKCVAF